MPYLPYAERLLASCTRTDPDLNAREALLAFQQLTGSYEDSDPWFEERSRLFFDYLIFDHPFPPFRSLSHRFFLEQVDKIRRDGTLAVYRGLLGSHAGVFDVEKTGPSSLVLKDLIGGGRFSVVMAEGTYGFVEGVVLSARIIPFMGDLVLGRGLLLHSDLATPHIHKLMAELKKEALLAWNSFHLLARMKLQYDVSPNFKLSSIYSPRSFLIKR